MSDDTTSRPTSRTEAIAASIRDRITGRILGAGEKLPSIRRLAATMRVSPSTVVEAYERLSAEGLVRARPGSGFYVAQSAAPRTPGETAPPRDITVDPFWVSRQSLDASTEAVRPGCGWLPPEWMPQEAIRKALRTLARSEGAALTDYGSTRGALPLRRLLARRMAVHHLEPGADQLLLTASGTQSIDLICRLLLRPGDTVLVDDPCYFNFRALLHAHGANVVGVPYTASGPDCDRFAEIASRHRPKLYVTNAAWHNPTGATISPHPAHQVLTLAAANDLVVVEDEIFGDLEPEPSPRLASLDGLARVIRIGSFSKTLSASVRCGYVAARRDWIDALADVQVATNFGGPSPLAAELVLHVLADGSYRRHLGMLHGRLARARREAAEALAGLGILPRLSPRGGFYLWCTLPDGIDAADLARLALEEGVVLAPGNVFSVSQTAGQLMRFNVSQMPPRAYDTLRRALARAAEAT